VEELIQHGVNALKETVRTKDIKLNVDNTAAMVVGRDMDIRLLDDKELEPYVQKVEAEDAEHPVVNENPANVPNGAPADAMEVDD